MADLINHGTFSISRLLPTTPDRAFNAFAFPAEKRRWFVETPGFSTYDYRLDCRAGGSEFWHGTAPDGFEVTYSASYFDVLPGQRLLLSYSMSINGAPLSLSLLSILFAAEGAGTRLTLHEDVAHLDGRGTAEGRRDGTERLMDALAANLSAG